MALPRAISERIAKHLEPIALQHGTILAKAGTVASHVIFPERGIISLVKTMRDGRTAEVGFVGKEGFLGLATLMGSRPTAFEAIAQLDGFAQGIRPSLLRAEMEADATVRELVLRYMYYSMNQLAQSAACNRLHTLRQRCCRWLLVADENAEAPTFTLTHEFLALMMGVNRPSLSLTIAGLKRHGLVKYVRASITVLDRGGLESGTCECYWALRHESDRVYGS